MKFVVELHIPVEAETRKEAEAVSDSLAQLLYTAPGKSIPLLYSLVREEE